MKFLKTSTDVKNQISRMLPKCAKLRWAVAWASHEKCPLFDLLHKHRNKIHQATIGIHFYQTHPDFIDTFMDHKAVTFVMKPKGVFHPKLYFFEYENGDWECICGSPNFTRSAFSDNAEVAVLFGNADLDAPSAKSDIIAVLDDFKAMGERLTAKQLAEYRSIWQRQQVRLKSLSGELGGNGKPTPSPFERPLIVAEWPEYLSWVKEDKVHSTEGRLAVLEQAHKLFTADIQFNKMGDLDRKRIAGFMVGEKLDWLLFGSMVGPGYFKQAINNNNLEISAALDEIPLTGEVTKGHFDRYLQNLRLGFQNSGIATGTRLLAMKRPDYFICVDGPNQKRLCQEFNIAKHVELEDYWDKVILQITESNWWNSPEPADLLEKRIWNCRAAFLDVKFFEPPGAISVSDTPVQKDQRTRSPLYALGYQVGDSGLGEQERRTVLDKAFRDELPIVGTPEYMARWGLPGTLERLDAIIAHITKTRRDRGMSIAGNAEAVEDWTADLDWLNQMLEQERRKIA